MTRQLYEFNGGVHPEEHKHASTSRQIGMAPLPRTLIVSLRQHIGQPAKPIVTVGEQVLKGQMIGQAEGYVSVAVHAPTSGTVTAIAGHAVAHPSGLTDLCITIAPDGADRWIEHSALDYRNMDPSHLRNQLRDLGIAGLGGAVFPSFIKLNPGATQKVPTLILNGGECEPWITCDDMLMRERAAEILAGAAVMRYMLHSDEVLVGIEDNKPEAIAAMQAAASQCDFPVEVVTVPTLYPGGGAKQLIKTLTGKEVPSGGRSTDVGVATFNVGTAYALHRAVNHGEPLISRIVTVTGNVHRPQNFEVLIGTPLAELVRLTGATRDDTSGYVMGGPMMGFDLISTDVPVVKATNCILVKSQALFPPPPPAMPCIRCTRCAQACPADLQPQELYWFARAKNFGKTQEYHLFDCIECGCCSYVCPSHIPLVQYYRYAKSEIWAKEKDKKAADLARERHEFRQLRIEREQQERAAKLALKASAKLAETSPESPDDAANAAKKAAIQAALARAKEKKEGATPRNVENLPPEKLQEIAEIEARRAKIRAMAKDAVEK
ncbi:electron transport complex subunit RsxC [Sulfuriferula sp. GW1]|uniref:electron transport complex subunit RsxC n=1 Tax=Sulfuriferula sp. GW1 TaxID=3345111 RepID=UPI0039AFEC84